DTVLKLSIDIWDSKNNQDKQSFINELELLQKKYILLSKVNHGGRFSFLVFLFLLHFPLPRPFPLFRLTPFCFLS
ncbi:MAG: hypothetical protein Q8835_03515, partial [Sweet potato little leaf phytoplasma]|nr:hypothetical protein [Sweet potato little leaf phytoplasma]